MSKTKTRDQLIGEFRAAGTGPMAGSDVGRLHDALGPYAVRQVFIYLSGSAPDRLDAAIREMGGIEDDDAVKDVNPPSAAEVYAAHKRVPEWTPEQERARMEAVDAETGHPAAKAPEPQVARRATCRIADPADPGRTCVLTAGHGSCHQANGRLWPQDALCLAADFDDSGDVPGGIRRVCELEKGHDGRHTAFGGPDRLPVYWWPQDAVTVGEAIATLNPSALELTQSSAAVKAAGK